MQLQESHGEKFPSSHTILVDSHESLAQVQTSSCNRQDKGLLEHSGSNFPCFGTDNVCQVLFVIGNNLFPGFSKKILFG